MCGLAFVFCMVNDFVMSGCLEVQWFGHNCFIAMCLPLSSGLWASLQYPEDGQDFSSVVWFPMFLLTPFSVSVIHLHACLNFRSR